ncbi:tetratricopeptide repeat protein [Brevundimonas sp. Leaf363]|uniref:tetratricopeptide repeat protein n=1 Tax=Brevundimonas sp. Leaf363 TaxID=1736353 RepID=UPI0012E2754F|nr:tetratricopeptide repeat protein [Brevundimonas sp. Leaf363]
MSLDTLPPDADAAEVGFQPTVQDATGDAASPEALGRLTRALAKPTKTTVKQQKKLIERLRASVAGIKTHQYGAASAAALEALKIDDRSGLAWHILAIAQEKEGRVAQALSAYQAAVRLLPDETDVAQDLARLAQRLGYLEIAEKLLRKFLANHPGHVEASNNLACSLRDQKRYGEAIGLLQQMIALEPTSPILWNTVGTVMSDQGESAKALPFFEEALRLDPAFAKARYNRANVRFPLGDAQGALEDLEAAASGAEGGYETAMMKMAHAMQLMAMGRIGEGFAAYDVRLDPALPDAVRPVIDAPRWDGATPLEGRRILVLGEQGLADEMVFGSCLPDLIDAVGPTGQVYVSVEKRLVEMFQRSFQDAIVGAHRAVRLEGRLTRFVPFAEDAAKADGRLDAYIPMGSLMAAFRPDIDSFPDRDGYLVADPVRVERWRTWLDDLGPGLKVGLHWKSLVLTGVRARYFSSFERWSPVLTTPGCVMINLQCGDTEADLAEAAAAGVVIHTPPINLKDDLEDVAALSVTLDLVIGPGIAGTNIAAAVGARTWMIHAPDDWHLLGTDRYPFYPRMRTFATGGFNGWPGAIDRVRAALDKAVSGHWNTA